MKPEDYTILVQEISSTLLKLGKIADTVIFEK
jgi:hypothetical protein